jgi:hypothetical protein
MPATPPTAELSHATTFGSQADPHASMGRARLRFTAERGDDSFFERLGQELAQHPDVQTVRVSARTGSVLFSHRGALAPILDFAAERGLFVVAARPLARTPMRRIQLAIADMDRRLARETRGVFSLGTATFLGLVAAGLYQARRGKLLPAGTTLFSYAFDVMQREAEREAADSPVRPEDVAGT